MAGTGGGGSGSRGGDNNEERLRKMVADHLRASELFTIDTRTPEGLASLTAILGQALQAGLTVGEAQKEEEARKAAEAKAAEKKRKRDEGVIIGAFSPRTLEKKRRKDERDAIRKENVTTPLWPSVGVKPNTPKVGDLESSGTPECLEFDNKAQNTSHWAVLGVIGKVLKRRYRKWPRIGHLDICSPSYGQKKGRESN
jgi:hypothetical protein